MSTASPAANWIAQAEVTTLPRLPIPPLQDTLKYRPVLTLFDLF